MVKTKLDDYFEALNDQYRTKGLEWHVVNGHYWLELRILKHYRPWAIGEETDPNAPHKKPKNRQADSKNSVQNEKEMDKFLAENDY
jgi:hypothetical protein